jgi:flagellar FliL protein
MSEEDTQGRENEDAEAGGTEEEEDEQSSKFSARKIILYVIAPLFILAGIGGGLYFSGALDSMLASDKKTETKDKKEKEKAETTFLKIPDILVNLKSKSGQPRYLRLKVKLELKSKKDMEKVKAVMPRIVDQFQTFLRELRVKDLRGSAGIYRLQKELLARVNAAAPDANVRDVLFQEMLIQ